MLARIFRNQRHNNNGNEDGLSAELRERLSTGIQDALKLLDYSALIGGYHSFEYGSPYNQRLLDLYNHHSVPSYFSNITNDSEYFITKRNLLVGELFRCLYPKNWKAALANDVFVRPEILRAAFLQEGGPLVLSRSGNTARTFLIDFGKNALWRASPDREREIDSLCIQRDVVEVVFPTTDKLERLFLGECPKPWINNPLRAPSFTDNRTETIFRMCAAFRVAEVVLQDIADRWRGRAIAPNPIERSTTNNLTFEYLLFF